MSAARFVVGDVFDVLATLEDGSVDLVLSSPPFLALRSYLPADHPDKAKEIGSEATPADFLDTLLDVTEACRRVLAPHGSLVFELGDTYSGSGGAGGDYGDQGLREGQPKFKANIVRYTYGQKEGGRVGAAVSDTQIRNSGGPGWPLDKSLCGIPTLFAWSLAYGRNLLRPERETERWRVRNVVAWCRPNPPVGALGDKFRPATSYLTVACKARDRWFDLDAVRVPVDRLPHTDNRGGHKREGIPGRTGQVMNPVDENGHRIQANPAGAPPLDWWEIPTQPYKGAHYATWPEALCVRPIESMCPRRACRTCGEPSRRITGDAEYVRTDTDRVPARLAMSDGDRVAERVNQHTQANGANTSVTRQAPTLGWSDCGHDNWRPGIVLDPFAGSGTTLAVAVGHGRDAIGIDLDPRNADLARERVGMFLEVEQLRLGGAA